MARSLKFPFYPILFAALPIAFLAAQNLVMISWRDPLRALWITWGASAVLWIILRLILRNWHRAALVCSAFLLYFFFFGHAINLLEELIGHAVSFAGLTRIAAGATVALLAGVFGLLQLRRAETITPVLNSISVGLLVFNLASIGVQSARMTLPAEEELRQLAHLRGDGSAAAAPSEPPAQPAPDVYFIVLDAYEREDMLNEFYRYDNHEFITALRERGFYVADKSRSNYLITLYSLPSTLNMILLDDLSPSLLTRLTSSMQVNFVQDFLEARGYQSVNFETWYEISNDSRADEILAPPPSGTSRLNPFEILLVKTAVTQVLFTNYLWNHSAGGLVLEDAIEQDLNQCREQALYAFEHIPDYADREGQYFVFSHFMVPHYPYIWGPQGAIVPFDAEKSLVQAEMSIRSNAWYYTGQLEYVNQLTLNMIDQILARSETPPVIILQGDHGHDGFLDWEAPTHQGLNVRSAVLNAIYLPEGGEAVLYPEISLVNTFRVVFNHSFGTRYPLLPDEVFAGPGSREPLQFDD